MAAAVPIASLPPSDSTPFPTVKAAPATSKSNPSALKPNPHPYAIKTSSTGALARSNSSSAAASVRHHYVPSSAPRSPERSNSRSEYRGHRYSTSISGSSDRLQLSPTRSERSLSEDSNSGLESPAPLPSPGPRRSKRAETLPTVDTATAANIAAFAAGVTSVEDLPSNPKLWTPAQLSSYLVRALRVRAATGEAVVAAPVARDIAAWVRAQSITGRVFLRWTEEDLEILGTNILWRAALLNASRNLRQNVIRGRIWGSSSPPTDNSFPSELHNSSSTESLNADNTGSSPGTKLRRRNAGRVKGLVNRWETTSQSGSEAGSESESELPASLSSFTSFHPHSAPASRTAFTGAETGPAPWPSSAIGEGDEPTMEELLAAGEDKKGSWGARAWEAFDVPGGIQETVKRVPSDGEKELPPPPPYASPQNELGEKEQVWDTIVQRRDGSGSSSGGSGGFAGSAKRVRGGTASGKGKKDSRRIVTAVFMPETASEEQESTTKNAGHTQDSILEESVKEDRATQEDEDARVKAVEDARIAALESEVAASRALLVALRERLEAVEGRVAAMEVYEEKLPILKAHPIPVEAPIQPATGFDKVIRRAEARKSNEDDDDKAKALEPYTLGDIPSYVVLVGLGVCAVVLRVVMHRVALGRRA